MNSDLLLLILKLGITNLLLKTVYYYNCKE